MKTGLPQLPQMTTAERDALNPAAPTLVWNKDTRRTEYFDLNTNAWERLDTGDEGVPIIPTHHLQVSFGGSGGSLISSGFGAYDGLDEARSGGSPPMTVEFDTGFNLVGDIFTIPETGVYRAHWFLSWTELLGLSTGSLIYDLYRDGPFGREDVLLSGNSYVEGSFFAEKPFFIILDGLFEAEAGDTMLFRFGAPSSQSLSSPVVDGFTIPMTRYSIEQIG